MTPTATRTGLPTALLDQVMALTPEQREELMELAALEEMPSDPRTEEQLMADLVRDAEAADASTVPSLTREQARDHVRKTLRDKYGFEL